MNSEEKEVFRKIAGCSIANRIVDDLEAGNPNNDPCYRICSYQQEEFDKLGDEQVRFSKETFHMPEPWNGNLSEAKILFVSSNPSFDINETTPELARKKNKEVLPKIISDTEKDDPETKKALDEAENFFENRFLDETGSIREEYENETWKRILKFAGYLLGRTRSIERGKKLNNAQKEEFASCIALTEVVHCKSPGEEGVEAAAETCYDKHTRAVIELFLKSLKSPSEEFKKVVVMGVKTQAALAKGILAEPIKADDPEISAEELNEKLETLWNELDELRKDDLEEFEKEMKNLARDGFGALAENALFIFIPHPVAKGYSYAEFQRRFDRQCEPLRQ
ncbi:hypothetical protein M3G18_06690 [Corynebacterium sp. p3-SID1145]|uniref:hypothetical protein n=1 Tax=unclassified Corynebacterium TaxID=2624378 RepID=UPI0021A9F1B8|nr:MULTISPECIES: hypothetical protein [unclassified Corynebacterium]MCT1452592.1 hypothetical protein [Corynebacterium sp. p3-SID1145]MCT1461494.1 hypothetical protein [Corynebacterium sp. p3-SID1140]